MFASRWRWNALFAQGSGLARDLSDDRGFLGVMYYFMTVKREGYSELQWAYMT